MALMQNMRKLKVCLRPASACKGDFLRGKIKCLFDVGSSSPVAARGLVSDPVSVAVGFSLTRRSIGYSFSKLYSSSWTPAARHRTSSFFAIQYQAFLFTEDISRMLSTSAIPCPWLRGGRCCSVDWLTNFRVSNLENLLEVGLYLLTGQYVGRFFSERLEADATRQVINIYISGLQRVWNQHRLSDEQIHMDSVGVVDVEACKCKPRVLTSRRSYRHALEGFDGLCEADEDSEVEGYSFGGNIYVQGMILEYVTMQGFLHAKRVWSLSIPHYSFNHVSLVSVLEILCKSFAGKRSSHWELSGHCELLYKKDRSINLDNEGVQHLNLRLLSGACCLPHPNKVKTGGEDAYFISSEEQVVGVADGVGGWADVGVDAGNYARELMLQSKLAVAQEPHGYIDPARVLTRAHARTKCPGSSTACILALSDNGLQAANLGDSGFVMIRNGRIMFKSSVQQHQFNIPFQLENVGSDPPTSAAVYSVEVASGDVLVAGTDGLFDNLYDNELVGIVTNSTRAGLDPHLTAHNIAALARERAEDRNRQTPFSAAAQDAGYRFYGGKMDDITVIVSFVTTIKLPFLHL